MHILLIEDDQSVADFISKGLIEKNHVVDHCPDGKEGLFMATTEDYDVMIIADHGNADEMFNIKNGKKDVKTAHTLNPVPFVIYDPNDDHEYEMANVEKPSLTNIAGTILNLLGYQNVEDYDESLIKVS